MHVRPPPPDSWLAPSSHHPLPSSSQWIHVGHFALGSEQRPYQLETVKPTYSRRAAWQDDEM